MAAHRFGGNHTKIKLEVVRLYIDFYTRVLKKQPFKLIYVDPFAGSGDCEIKISAKRKDTNTIDAFENTEHEPSLTNTATIDGSAKIALNIDRLFDEYHFVEENAKRYEQLESLKAQHNDKVIHLYKGDANKKLLKILQQVNWKNTRAIIFIDPYGMETEWETLVAIANTKAVDLWYLFPLSGVYRQAANNYDSMDKGKIEAINRMLGTDEWQTTFYESKQGDMFGSEPLLQRTADIDDIVRFTQERLSSIFAEVPEPKLLPDTGPVMFALFFAVANPRAASISLRGANHIIKHMKLR